MHKTPAPRSKRQLADSSSHIPRPVATWDRYSCLGMDVNSMAYPTKPSGTKFLLEGLLLTWGYLTHSLTFSSSSSLSCIVLMTSKLLSTSSLSPLPQLPFFYAPYRRPFPSQRSCVMRIWSCATSHLFIPNYTLLWDYVRSAAEQRGNNLHNIFRKTNGNLKQC